MKQFIRGAMHGAARAFSNSVSWITGSAAWKGLIVSLGGRTSAGVNVNHKSAMGYPPLWRAVSIIANDMARMPCVFYRRTENDSRERAREDDRYHLIRRKPDPNITWPTFVRTLTYHALIDGNGYAFITRDSHSNPLSMTPLVPAWTYPVVEYLPSKDVEGELVRKMWYVTRDSQGQQRKLDPEDILHIKGLSYDGFMGHSVIDLMKEALGLGIAARQFANLFFGQGLNSKGFLEAPRKLGADELNDLRTNWPKMEAGLKRAHLPAILHGGVKWVQTSVNPDEAQALETRQLEIRECANITGVRPHKLGDTTRTSYNSLEMENQSHLDEAIDPWAITWEDELNDKLLTSDEKKDESRYFEFSRSALVRLDAKTQIEIDRKEREMGAASVNDLMRRQNRQTIGPEGDVRHIPGNWQILSDKPPEPKNGKGTPPAPPPDEDEEDAGAEDTAAEKLLVAVRGLCLHQVGLLLRSEADQVTRAAKRETNFIGWMDRYYESHQAKLEAAYRPLCQVIDPCGDAKTAAKHTAEWHATVSRNELLDAADGDAATFVDRVRDLAVGWSDGRIADVCEMLFVGTPLAAENPPVAGSQTCLS